MQKLLTFFSKNISMYAIFNDQTFNDTLNNDIVSFEQLGSDWLKIRYGRGTLMYSARQGTKMSWNRIQIPMYFPWNNTYVRKMSQLTSFPTRLHVCPEKTLISLRICSA